MNNEEYWQLLEQEQKIRCVGGCGTPIGVDILNHPPEKYAYCHSFCCWCCPDANKEICQKEAIEMNLLAMETSTK